jgi:type II secretion system protein N
MTTQTGPLTWKDRVKKYAPYAVFPAVYLVLFVVFAYVTFPYDALRDRIVVNFNAEQKKLPAPMELHIDELTSAFPVGAKATGVKLVSSSTDKEAGPSTLALDEVRARISVFRLIFGTKAISFRVKGLGGEASGDVVLSSKEKDVEAELEGIDVGQIPAVVAAIGLPLEGKATGTVKLNMPEGKAAKSNGSVNLEIAELAVGDGKAKIKNMIALPKVNVGTLSIVAEAKDGTLKVTKLSAGGRDVDLQGEGRIALREMATESNADLFIRFKINDAYRGKSDMTKNIFGAPGSTQAGLIEMADPKVKRSKREDGFYAWHAKGALARLELEPAPQFAGPGTSK